MPEKRINGRAVQKHDIEANWLKATNFTPLQGEIIIYDKDENYDYERIKVGDGSTLVSNLPFVTDAIDERLDAIEDDAPISVKTTSLTVPANSDATYTTLWNDALQTINISTNLEGYPESSRNNEHYGICLHSPDSSVPECVYSGQTTEIVKIIRDTIEQSGGAYSYGFNDGAENTFTIYNHTSVDAVVYVEETRLNAEMLEYFATKAELESKADIDELDAKADSEDVEADISAINSELANKISISDAENMTTALDNGNVAKITNLTIPSGGTATYTFLWEESGLPNTQFSCGNPAAISPTEEYTGVRIAGKNNSTMSHIVYGEEPVVISEIGESTLIYGGGFTKGAENTFTIHNHTSTEVVVKVEEFESSKIDERLTALEERIAALEATLANIQNAEEVSF